MEIKIREVVPSEADFLQRIFYEEIFVPEGENALPPSIVHHPAL